MKASFLQKLQIMIELLADSKPPRSAGRQMLPHLPTRRLESRVPARPLPERRGGGASRNPSERAGRRGDALRRCRDALPLSPDRHIKADASILVEPGFDAARSDDVGGQIMPLIVALDLSDLALRA